MDNVVRKFFSNGKNEELMFNVYQGHNTNSQYRKSPNIQSENITLNYSPKKTLKRQSTQIEGLPISKLNSENLSNVRQESKSPIPNIPNPNIIPNLHSTPEVKFILFS